MLAAIEQDARVALCLVFLDHDPCRGLSVLIVGHSDQIQVRRFRYEFDGAEGAWGVSST